MPFFMLSNKRTLFYVNLKVALPADAMFNNKKELPHSIVLK